MTNTKIKAGKIISTVIMVVLFVVGLVIVFLPQPIDRMNAFSVFVRSILPVILPLTSGVAIKGLIKAFVEKGGNPPGQG